MKAKIKIPVLLLIGALLGFFVAIVLYTINTGGGGFHFDSPDGKQKFLIGGFDKGIYGKHQVAIMHQKNQTLTLEPVFTYLHHAGGLYLREQENKKIEWSNDSKSVKVTYEDKIYGEKVLMSFEYNVDSEDWVLKKTSG